MPPPDWHPEDVKAAIRKSGTTLTALALAHGLSESAVRMTMSRPWPRVEALIARHLGRRPQEIWPSRYDTLGQPRRGLRAVHERQRSAVRTPPHRQKSAAA
jgi:Ner family transcriptional regulator